MCSVNFIKPYINTSVISLISMQTVNAKEKNSVIQWTKEKVEMALFSYLP